MPDQSEPEGRPSSARGEAAWQEARDAVAARNRAARKAAMQEREAHETERNNARRAAELKQHSELVAKQDD